MQINNRENNFFFSFCFSFPRDFQKLIQFGLTLKQPDRFKELKCDSNSSELYRENELGYHLRKIITHSHPPLPHYSVNVPRKQFTRKNLNQLELREITFFFFCKREEGEEREGKKRGKNGIWRCKGNKLKLRFMYHKRL